MSVTPASSVSSTLLATDHQKGTSVTSAIRPPFFEIGPKTFLDRAALLEVADAAWQASVRYEVAVIITPPALDIEAVKHTAQGLWVFAQSMDMARPGASTGAILPEALAAVGANGVMLNHAERPVDDGALPTAISRARDAGLLTLICADTIQQATRYAACAPDLILLEPHDLIGTAGHRRRPSIAEANAAVASVDPGVLVMHGGGVADEHHVRAIMTQGAAGTGCTTAIVKAADRRDMTARMIRAVREGWDARYDLIERPVCSDGSKAH
jgi:triosephosphate isomerase (TIM)